MAWFGSTIRRYDARSTVDQYSVNHHIIQLKALTMVDECTISKSGILRLLEHFQSRSAEWSAGLVVQTRLPGNLFVSAVIGCRRTAGEISRAEVLLNRLRNRSRQDPGRSLPTDVVIVSYSILRVTDNAKLWGRFLVNRGTKVFKYIYLTSTALDDIKHDIPRCQLHCYLVGPYYDSIELICQCH